MLTHINISISICGIHDVSSVLKKHTTGDKHQWRIELGESSCCSCTPVQFGNVTAAKYAYYDTNKAHQARKWAAKTCKTRARLLSHLKSCDAHTLVCARQLLAMKSYMYKSTMSHFFVWTHRCISCSTHEHSWAHSRTFDCHYHDNHTHKQLLQSVALVLKCLLVLFTSGSIPPSKPEARYHNACFYMNACLLQ